MMEHNLSGIVHRRCGALVRLATAAVLSASMFGALPAAGLAQAQNEIFDLASFYQTDESNNLVSYEAWTRRNLELLAGAVGSQ